jgi:hypothetical protein
MKILLDFSEKTEREDTFKPAIGNKSLHEISNYNGIRVLKFATLESLIVKGTMFSHHSIHKCTWTSPDGKMQSHIGLILICRRCWPLSGDCKS